MAEIAIENRSSYDYWAIRRNGDFYSLFSLFEDRENKPGQLFFDTRVVRATEGLLYCARLYSRLEVDPSSKIQFSLRFSGLKDRILSTTNFAKRYSLQGRRCVEDDIETEVSTSLQEIEGNLVELVKQLLSPLFMLFDFFELSDAVYEDLVNKFVRGEA